MQSILMISGVECKTVIINEKWNVIVNDRPQKIYRELVRHKGKKNEMSYSYKLKGICQVCGEEFFRFLNAQGKYCSKKCSNSRGLMNSKRINSSDNDWLKRRASAFIRNEIETGRIERCKVCCNCGSGDKIEAHHPDYNKPWEIIWWCRHCHMKFHFGHKIEGKLIVIKDLLCQYG